MKLLINTPDYHKPSSGGVASFYYGMQGYWNEQVRYNIVGRRRGVSGAVWLPWDVMKFVGKLLLWHPDGVLINPSLNNHALKRDFVFLRVARQLGIKVCVLIHGFDLQVAKTIDQRWVRKNLNMASLIMVLASQFRQILQQWGITKSIELVTTKVEDRMLEGFDIDTRDGHITRLLFLSRMERAKGVYETVDTFALLKTRHPELTLTMVGDGTELEALKTYVASHHIHDVTFTGALNGEDRLRVYREAHFFFFSSYGEGMPTVVLEAMAFGMPVMTRYVGGLTDFFEDGKMGRISHSLRPQDFADMMEPFFTDPSYTKHVARYNHAYALEHFMASKVGKKLEQLIQIHVE